MKKRRIGSAASGRKGGADPQLKEIMRLCGKVVKLQKRCRELGMFMEDRELLECPYCWLEESVDINGLHLVTLPLDRRKDTGLRFAQVGKSGLRWRCPNCGREFKGGGDIGADEGDDVETKVEKLKVRTACHDIQIQTLYEAIRRLSETSDRVTMFPAITYPAARQHRRPDIQSS